MKKLDLSSVSTSNGFPLKSGSLNHVQSAYQEAIAEAIKGIVGPGYDATKGYILSGLVNSGSGSAYDISSGALFFNGEVYLCNAAAFTISGSNVAIGTITTGFDSGPTTDPVPFTDGINRNVHQIRRIVFSSGLSGAGAVIFTQLLRANASKVPVGSVIIYVPQTMDLSEFSGGLGIAYNVKGYAIADGTNGTVDLRRMFVVGYDSTDSDYNAIGKTGGAKAHTMTLSELVPHSHGIGTQNIDTDSTFNLAGSHTSRSWNGTPQEDANDHSSTDLVGGGQPFSIRPPFYTVLYIQRIY